MITRSHRICPRPGRQGHSTAGRWLAPLLLLLLVTTFFACGEDAGTDPPPPVMVSFEPPAGSVLLGTFEVLRVEVTASSGEVVEARFLVDGSEVATGATYDFMREIEGTTVLRAEVDLDGKRYVAEWSIEVSTDIVDPVPAVQAVTAVSGQDPGTIAVDWNAPPPTLVKVPLQDYLVSWSTSPIDPGDDLDALPFAAHPHDGSAISQSTVLTGLAERELHYVVVRARDVLGRVSTAPAARSCEATGHYDLWGEVRGIDLDPAVGVRAVRNVLIDVEGRKVLTDDQGEYSLLALPDLQPQIVRAAEESGAIYYEIRTEPLEPLTRRLDMLLVPRELVELRVISGADSSLALMDYVRLMTHNDNDDATFFHPWASYPVDVFVHDYVHEDGAEGPVDYAAAFEYAVQTWNDVAGEELLRVQRVAEAPSAADPGVGIFYAPDFTPGSTTNLGEVRVLRPSGTQLYEAPPEWLVVRLRSNFNDDWVARYVITHELGHTLGLTHSPTLDDIMYFAVQSITRPDDPRPSRQEAFVARVLRHVGSGVDSVWYTTPDAIE